MANEAGGSSRGNARAIARPASISKTSRRVPAYNFRRMLKSASLTAVTSRRRSMKFVHPRIALLAALVLLAVTPAAFAQKRRSVRTPSPGAAFTANIKGTVVDAATGAPVAFASISIGNSRTAATREGNFELANVTGYGTTAKVSASRSGYTPQELPLPGAGT